MQRVPKSAELCQLSALTTGGQPALFDDDVAAAKRDTLAAWFIKYRDADTAGAFASVPTDREPAIGRAVITNCLNAAHGRDHAHQW